jgi:hypothetical protein
MDKSDAICEMTFQCSKELKDFSDTRDPNIKFCSDCQHHVEVITTEEELIDAADRKAYVTILDDRIAKTRVITYMKGEPRRTTGVIARRKDRD